uniref:Uncharacterized protein n=1 Tax=Sipha flava TaxID=143950 RepID=A0A2S2QZP7_9HEMI
MYIILYILFSTYYYTLFHNFLKMSWLTQVTFSPEEDVKLVELVSGHPSLHKCFSMSILKTPSVFLVKNISCALLELLNIILLTIVYSSSTSCKIIKFKIN